MYFSILKPLLFIHQAHEDKLFYQIVLHALPMGGRDNQKDTQQQWLKKRNACAANVSCISKAYQQRQKQLDTILQDRVLSHGPF